MNLVKAAELLKNAPEDTLKKYLANPNGEFPEYLVVSEIARRDDMRKRYAAELQGQPPKTSIIEELLQRDNAALRQPAEPPMQEQAPSTAMGLGSVPPPPDMQLSAPPMVAAAQQPQQFYDGGVVALAGGGGISDVADAFNEYMRPGAHGGAQFSGGGEVEHFATGNPVVYKPDLSAFNVNTSLMQPQEITQVQDLPFYQKQMADLVGPSATEGYQESLAKQRGDIEGRKKNYLSDFLIRSGLGMAAAKTPHPLQAAAQGLASGFEDYQKSKEADAAAERALIDSEFKFKQAQRAENMGLLGLSRQAMSDAMADRRSGQEAARSAEALRLQAAVGKEAALRGAADIGLRGEEVILRGKEIAAANQRHKEEIALREREIKDRIASRQEITPAIRAQAANVVSDAIVRYRKTLDELPPDWYTKAQEEISSATNDIARQTAIQRLENQIRINSGLSADILKIAGFN